MYLGNLNIFDGIKISALDIGCSGFKPMEWERFRRNLKYYGVDPLVNEIQSLQKRNPESSYISAFIKAPGATGHADALTSHFFSRTSAFHDMNSGFDLVKENFNSGKEVVYSNRKISLFELLGEFEINKLDLLKIDVDGDDFPILKSFFDIEGGLKEGLLGFEIESQFHGDSGEYGNNFANILNLANENNFYLYKLDSYTYSRNSLRKKYVHPFPAQTHGGQIMWGDALFLRDGLSLESKEDILKMILILHSYDLEDCAFEILEEKSNVLGINEENLKLIKANLNSSNLSKRRNKDLINLIKYKIKRCLRA